MPIPIRLNDNRPNYQTEAQSIPILTGCTKEYIRKEILLSFLLNPDVIYPVPVASANDCFYDPFQIYSAPPPPVHAMIS